jgi:hypothetical protein
MSILLIINVFAFDIDYVPEPNSLLSVPMLQLVQRKEIKMSPNIFFISLLSGEIARHACCITFVHSAGVLTVQ